MPLPPSPVITCFIKFQIGLTFLVPAYVGCPGKEAVKRVSVFCWCMPLCLCYSYLLNVKLQQLASHFANLFAL